MRGGFFRRSRENKGKTNMKQLKFMLAAATAIGLATAAQAGATDQYSSSTGFEELALSGDNKVTTGTDDYFYYDGEANDNESKIVGAAAPTGMDHRPYGTGYFKNTDKDGTAQVLKVDTGTNALFRALEKVTDAPVAQSLTKTVYVDTLVQFTVTPWADTVVNTAEDKLMVYLKEMTNGVGAVTGTNLVVKAGYLGAENPAVAVPKEYVVNTGTVGAIVPGVWYRLTVEAIPNLATAADVYYPAFKLIINGEGCSFDTAAIDISNNAVVEYVTGVCSEENLGLLTGHSVVLSLCADGNEAATLKAVGFAGEGYVDDLIISTELLDAPISTGVDFTLTLGEGVSAVTWTIVDGGQTVTATKEYTGIEEGTYTITNVDYEDWYVGKGNYVKDASITVVADGEVKVEAEKILKEPEEGSPTVTIPATTAPADLGIKSGSFYATSASKEASEALSKAMTWALNKGGKGYSDAIDLINTMEVDDDVTTNKVNEAAYLFNCEPTAEKVKEAAEAFVFEAFDPTKPPTPDVFAGKGYNGEVVIEGATTLSDETEGPNFGKPDWEENKQGAKFYRARLRK